MSFLHVPETCAPSGHGCGLRVVQQCGGLLTCPGCLHVACWEEFQVPCLCFVEAEKSKAHYTAGLNPKCSMISQSSPSETY